MINVPVVTPLNDYEQENGTVNLVIICFDQECSAFELRAKNQLYQHKRTFWMGLHITPPQLIALETQDSQTRNQRLTACSIKSNDCAGIWTVMDVTVRITNKETRNKKRH